MARVLRITMTWLALMTALSVVGASVSANADEASHWSKQRTGPRLTEPARSLSCPSRHSCTAIAGYGSTLHYDGHEWGAVTTADRDLMAVTSVSCPKRTFCGAAGGHVVVVEKHGHWRRVHPVNSLLEDVSCPSARWCLAVGRGGHTVRYDGSAWRRGPRAPEWLQSVSCTSRTFCMAEALLGKAYRFDGHRWHRAGDIPAAGAGPNGLSCGSRTLCLAAGGSRTAARWNGRRWVRHAFGWGADESGTSSCGAHYCELLTSAHAVEWHDGWGPVTGVPAGDAVTDSPPLSCSSRGRCVAVTADSPAMTLSLRNGTWRTGAYPGSSDVLQNISCPTVTFCMGLQHRSSARMLRDGHWSEVAMPAGWAFGFGIVCTSPTFCLANQGAGNTATWDGTSWSAGARVGTGAFIFDCASATYCVATDNTDHTETWDGTGWTAGPAASVSSISCPAPEDCWAGGEESEVVHFDGVAWSSPLTIAPSGVDGFNTITVRCASSTNCAAADQRGNVYIYQDGGWGGRTHLGGRFTDISALDCGSGSSCTAAFGDVFDAGETAHWNGSTWSETRALPRGYSGVLASLSCATQKVCVAIDWSGTAWVRD